MKFDWNDDEPILRGAKIDKWNNDAGQMEGKDKGDSTFSGLQTFAITTDKNIPLNIILTG